MYVREDSTIPESRSIVKTEYGYTSIFQEPLVKIIVSDPMVVSRLRESFETAYESDVRFVRRLLIDTQVRSGMILPDREQVYWKDIQPSDFSIPELICVTLDIEVDNTGVRSVEELLKNGDRPVIACSLHDTQSNRYVTIILDDEDKREWWSPDHLVVHVTKELELLRLIGSYLDKVEPDVLRNWNLYFDLDYLRLRGKRLGVDLAKSIDQCAQFDQLQGYRKIFKKASNRLKDVVIDEGITDTLVAEEFLLALYQDRKTRNLFIKYSHDDVMYCVKIDAKHRLTQYYWQLKSFAGLEDFSPTFFNSTVVDTLMLRYAHEHGMVLPSAHYGLEEEDEDHYKGATVLDPIPGKRRNVAIFDMSRFFPSIMLAWHLSPERSDGEGIFQKIILQLTQVRAKYDSEMDEVLVKFGPKSEEYSSIKERRQTVKDTLNSVYGYAGFQVSRLYKKEVASDTAKHSREGIEFLKRKVESGEYVSPLDGKSKSFLVIRGDTDSTHCECPLEEAPFVEKWLNDELRLWCESQGVEPLLKVNFEKYALVEVSVESKSEERGAKKFYALRIVQENGKPVDYLVVRGFDRRDSSKVGRDVRKKVLELICYDREEEIKPLILNVIKEIRMPREFSSFKLRDICINTGIHKDLDKYDNIPDYVRGSIYANKFLGLNIQAGDLVKMVPIKRMRGFAPTDILCVLDEASIPEGTEISYDELIRKTLQIKLESILKVVNIPWSTVNGQRTLLQNYQATCK